MSRRSRTGKRMSKRKRSFQPGAGLGDVERERAHRLRKEIRRG